MIAYSVVIAAAGSGSRMKLGYNKVYYLVNNRPLLAYTIDVFEKDNDCQEIIVVSDITTFQQAMKQESFQKVHVVQGGSTRQESIMNGLKTVSQDIVMIHDGARPYITNDLLNELKQAMQTERAACLMVKCKDTIKKVQNGHILETIPRETLMAAQTPQVFYTADLRHCFELASKDHFIGTDDCSLIEEYTDIQIAVVEGSYANIKVTTPEDLITLERKGLA